MLCDICKEQMATIHYTEVLPDSQPKKMALCESCAKQKNLLVTPQLSVGDILKGLTQAVQAQEEDGKTRCPRCRLTFARFRKGGRLGCGTCYAAFKSKLESILEEIHRGKQHIGKAPKSAAKQPGSPVELARLHRELKEAIDKEEFEEAAVLRDRIQVHKEKKKSGKTRK